MPKRLRNADLMDSSDMLCPRLCLSEVFLLALLKLATLAFFHAAFHSAGGTYRGKHTQKGFWTLWEEVRVGCFERTASKHVYYLG